MGPITQQVWHLASLVTACLLLLHTSLSQASPSNMQLQGLVSHVWWLTQALGHFSHLLCVLWIPSGAHSFDPTRRNEQRFRNALSSSLQPFSCFPSSLWIRMCCWLVLICFPALSQLQMRFMFACFFNDLACLNQISIPRVSETVPKKCLVQPGDTGELYKWLFL